MNQRLNNNGPERVRGFRSRNTRKFQDSEFVCLGNVNPEIQKKVILQLRKPKFVMIGDGYWIEGKLPQLKETMKLVDMMVVNDSEARMLSGEDNLIKASKKFLK